VKRHKEPKKEYRELSFELPVGTTAIGRVLLAFLPSDHIHEFLRHDSWARKYSKSQGAQDLVAELARVREQGYCMMHFEPHNESCSLAAPIFDASDAVKAAVSVSRKRHLSIWNDEHALREIVKGAAWEISSKLHYPKANNSSQKGQSSKAGANQSSPRTRAS
jgi:DNA-binding IclR family transcriptional regulator